MYLGTLVPRKTDEAELSRLLSLQDSLQCSSGGKDAVWIGVANDLVKLQEVNVIGLQSFQRFVDLSVCSRLVAASSPSS